MTPRVRHLALTVHIAVSVGWLGAVATFLALAVAGVTSPEPRTVRAAYLAMDLIGRSVIVPLGFASLISGLVQSLGTEWGLLRHHWVLIKFVLTVLALGFLLLHLRPIGLLAEAAAQRILSSGELRGLRLQIVADAGAALLVLLANTTLSVYKPRGLTAYGRRRQDAPASARTL